MRYYVKPELNLEVFDVEDVITASGSWYEPGTDPTYPDPDTTTSPISIVDESNTVEEEVWAANPYGSMDKDLDAAALAHTTLPLDGEVSGGSIVQEGLNSLYENFLSRF